MKGALERILALCDDRFMSDGRVVALSPHIFDGVMCVLEQHNAHVKMVF